eukprot:1160677-Pelagomonas_calceolata.AAC.12
MSSCKKELAWLFLFAIVPFRLWTHPGLEDVMRALHSGWRKHLGTNHNECWPKRGAKQHHVLLITDGNGRPLLLKRVRKYALPNAIWTLMCLAPDPPGCWSSRSMNDRRDSARAGAWARAELVVLGGAWLELLIP